MKKLVSVIAGLLIGCGVMFLFRVLPERYMSLVGNVVFAFKEAVFNESDSAPYLFKVLLWLMWAEQTLAMLLPIVLLSAIAVVIKTWTKESRFLVYSVLLVSIMTFLYWGARANNVMPLPAESRAIARAQCYVIATQAGLFFMFFGMIDAISRRYQLRKRS